MDKLHVLNGSYVKEGTKVWALSSGMEKEKENRLSATKKRELREQPTKNRTDPALSL